MSELQVRTTTQKISNFPNELTLAVEGLNNPHRQNILLALRTKDKLSFSEIGNKVGIKRPLLSNHLGKLENSLLVEHFYQHHIGDEKYSFYKISDFGNILLDSMINALYFKGGGKLTIRLCEIVYETNVPTVSKVVDPSQTGNAWESTQTTTPSTSEPLVKELELIR